MELLKSYMNRTVMVMLSNEAANLPASHHHAGNTSVGFQEIEGVLTAYDDTGAIEIEVEGLVYVLNWTWVVGISINPPDPK